LKNREIYLAEHKAVIDQSRLEVYNDDADSEIVWQSYHLKDRTEDYRSKESKNGQ